MAQTHNHCPFCQSDVGAEEELWRCPACSTPHHPECWRANRGCAVFGCRQGPGCRSPEPPRRENVGRLAIRCPLCQREIAAGQATLDCPDCGVSHHRECWRSNGGCATVGCTRAPRRWRPRSLDDLLQPPGTADVPQFLWLFGLFVVWVLLTLAVVGQLVYVVGYCVGCLRGTAPLASALPHVGLLAVLVALAFLVRRLLPRQEGPWGW